MFAVYSGSFSPVLCTAGAYGLSISSRPRRLGLNHDSPCIPRITPLCPVSPSPSYCHILSRRGVIPLPLHFPWHSDEDTHWLLVGLLLGDKQACVKNIDGNLKIGYTTIASITCIHLQIGRIIGGKANITGRLLYDDIQGFDSPNPE